MDHHHHSPPTHNFLHANKEKFDNLAENYDQVPNAIVLAQKCARAMMEAYPFKEDETVVMDFACGTGLISKELLPYTKNIVGVDISQGMVDQYNLRVQTESIAPEKMHAVLKNLEGIEGELDGMKFDVVVCAAAYHHFASIERVTQVLTYFLKPGGSLLVVDLEKVDRSFVGDEHRAVVPHTHGFDEASMRQAFEGSGLGSFVYQSAFKMAWNGTPAAAFIAKGTKLL